MSQHGRYATGGSSHNANNNNSRRYAANSAVPRTMPTDRYENTGYFDAAYQGWVAAGGPAAAGLVSDTQNYQLSSSGRGTVTTTDYSCVKVYTTWACGHETSASIRHAYCWKCSDLDAGYCDAEPVEIDGQKECGECEARRKEERRERRRRGREERRDRDDAREQGRWEGRERERSPRRDGAGGGIHRERSPPGGGGGGRGGSRRRASDRGGSGWERRLLNFFSS